MLPRHLQTKRVDYGHADTQNKRLIVHQKTGAFVGARRRSVERMVDAVEQRGLAAHSAEHDGRHVVVSSSVGCDRHSGNDDTECRILCILLAGKGHAKCGIFCFSLLMIIHADANTCNHQFGFPCDVACVCLLGGRCGRLNELEHVITWHSQLLIKMRTFREHCKFSENNSIISIPFARHDDIVRSRQFNIYV